MTARITPDHPEFMEAMTALRNAHAVAYELHGDRYPLAVLQLMGLGTFQVLRDPGLATLHYEQAAKEAIHLFETYTVDVAPIVASAEAKRTVDRRDDAD